MDCNAARRLAPFVRPQGSELEPADGQALNAHMAECPHCGPEFRADRRIDEWLGRSIREVPVPAGLKDRIRTRLTRDRNEGQRNRLRRAALLAASVGFVSFSLYFAWHFLVGQPTIDLAVLGTAGDRGTEFITAPTGEAVVNWFAARHQLQLELPEELAHRWDFSRLVSAHMAMPDSRFGKEVPVLEFRNGDKQARVYLLRRGEFKLQQIKQIEPRYASDPRVLGNAETDAYIAYVVFSKDSSPADFMKPLRPGTA